MKVLFPCKCDPIHTGHIIQIKKLVDAGYDVTVDVLLYKDRVMSLFEVRCILHKLFKDKVKVAMHVESYAYGFPPEMTRVYDMLVSGNTNILEAWTKRKIMLYEIKGYRATRMRNMYKDLK